MHSSYLSCSVALCPAPVNFDNGMVTFTGASIGDTATYSCDSGFELVGVATTTCTQENANSAAFLPQPPVCRREYCMSVTRVAIYIYIPSYFYVTHTGMRVYLKNTCVYFN